MKPEKLPKTSLLKSMIFGGAFLTATGLTGLAYAASPNTSHQPGSERMGYHSSLGQSYADYLIGQYAITQGDIHNSANGFENASLADPENLKLRDQAFLMAILDGNLEAAVRLNPQDDAQSSTAISVSSLSNAVIFLRAGQTAKAETYIEKLLVLNPNDHAANLLRALVLAKRGKWSDALDEGQSGLSEIEKDDPLLAFFLKAQKAKLLEMHSQYGEADTLYKSLIDQSVAAKSFFGIDYGHFLERRGRKDEAAALYKDLASGGDITAKAELLRIEAATYKKPSKPQWEAMYADAFFVTSSIALNQDDSEMALAYMQMSFWLMPTSDKRLINLGQAYAKLKDSEAAEAAWIRVPETSPSFFEARLNYIYSLKSRGELETARSEAIRLYAIYPQQLDLMMENVDILRSSGKPKEALEVISKRVELYGSKDFTWQVYFLEAMMFDELNEWDKAQSAIEEAMRLSEKRAEILNFYGYGLINREIDVKKGMDYVRQALKISPRSGAIIDSLGWGYFKSGDTAQAMMFVEQAVQLQPADPEINEHLGDVYMAAGRKVEAEYAWKRVLSLNPSDKIKQSVTAKLSLIETTNHKSK